MKGTAKPEVSLHEQQGNMFSDKIDITVVPTPSLPIVTACGIGGLRYQRYVRRNPP
jgi:hypothetical protein